MSELDKLMQAARETNETFLNADAAVTDAEAALEKARRRWGEANASREKAEAAVLNYIRSSVNGPG